MVSVDGWKTICGEIGWCGLEAQYFFILLLNPIILGANR
jgi:hypothetical protein